MASTDLIILVKAPNQLIGDQQVTCQRNWTVKELKEHLFEVYPSRPQPKDQKLIYSGQLLADSIMLSDVIKSYNGQEINTIHLVCTVKSFTNQSISPVDIESPAPVTTSAPVSPTPSPLQANSNASSTRAVPNESSGCFYSSLLANPPWYSCIPINRLSNNRHPESDEEFEWVHQAYINYLNSYLRMTELMCTTPLTNDSDDTSSGTDGEVSVDRQARADQEDGFVQQIHPQPVPGERENEEEDGHINRDLLEWIYIYFRFGVLFMFVYFYSSPIRFLLVVTMMVLLFYIDIERYRQRNGPQDAPVMEGAEPPVGEQAVGNPPAPPQNSWFSVVWTFISLFFLSLIPDLIY